MGVAASVVEKPASVHDHVQRYVELFARHLRVPETERPKMLDEMRRVLAFAESIPAFSAELVDAERELHLNQKDSDSLRLLFRHQRKELKPHRAAH